MSRLLSIVEAATELRTGRLMPQDLVERYLEQIQRFEPQVHAWVSVDEAGAREAAKQLGDELRRDHCRGPLHGIPLGIKDIVDVAGWPTQAGSPLRKDHRAQRDATLVARLRKAGAIILGKTVTTEFASFDPPPTRNPWNTERTPGGSSSGSAAAVALGMCLAAIGSQTGGSITRPASYCGVAGCKPTLGRVSTTGLVPLSFHLDHPGPIARSVGDLAVVLGAIAGYDPADPVCLDAPTADYQAALAAARPPRIGLLESFFMESASRPIQTVTHHALAALRAAGAEIVRVPLPASFADVHTLHRRIMAVEAADYHRAAFAAQRAAYGPNIASLIDEGLSTTAIDYAAALAHQHRFRREILAAFEGLNALVTPATADSAPGPEITGDPKFNSPWSYTGFPTVSLPCGLTSELLPASLQFIGPPLAEAPLFAAAAWCERQLRFGALPPLLS